MALRVVALKMADEFLKTHIHKGDGQIITLHILAHLIISFPLM
jgi:hypothetical protein